MDLEILYKDINGKKFTDVELSFVDDKETITTHLHKCVLISSSKYFEGLFSFGKEKNQSKISIKVDDAKIAHKIILSFYGKNFSYDNSTYLLKMFNIRTYFCLNNDVKLLYDIKVPKKDFNSLITVVLSEQNDDERLLQLVKKNMPLDYDLANLPNVFIKKLLNTNDYILLTGDGSKKIKLWNVETGCLIKTLDGHQKWITGIAISPTGRIFVSASWDENICILGYHHLQINKKIRRSCENYFGRIFI